MNDLQEKSFFSSVLDFKPDLFLNRFLYRLFKRVHFDENRTDELKQMHRKGTVVYAIKYRGHLDYMLYHYCFRRNRLPYPKIAFDLNMTLILPFSRFLKVLKFRLVYLFKNRKLPNPFKTGYFENAIQQGTPALLCLVDPIVFAKRFIHAEKGHVQFLLETQKKMDRPIYIVPQIILYTTTPEKEHSSLLDIFFGFKERPGFIRKIALFFRYHRRAFIDFGRPLDLKSFLENQPATRSFEDIAKEVKQTLIERIDAQKRVILGPIMKSRQQLKEQVLTDPGVNKTIAEIAGKNSRKLKQLKKNAGEYFDEIAADYNIAYIQFFNRFLAWLWKKIFQDIDVDKAGVALAREWARKGSVVYIPSHKSHIDYLVLNYVIYQHYMHIPRVAAGKNLSFWPLGHIFRKSGAFFIRRTFMGAKLYAKVFERYVKALLEEGHPLQFFIEGGRSRSGKLILPKLGFLSILLQAYREGYCDDLVFIPTSICYDRLLEEKAYLKEIGGNDKEKESFMQVLKTRHFLKQKYGKVYIRFSHPISFKEYLIQQGEDNIREISKELAFNLVRSINNATLVTPLSLIATAILTKHRRGFNLQDLTSTAGTLMDFLKKNDAPIATTLDHYEKTIEETLSLLINDKIVSLIKGVDGTETFYYVDDEKKRELEYYKNSIIHLWIQPSYVAVSLLTGKDEIKTNDEIRADYVFQKRLFKNEFVFNEKEDIQGEIDMFTAFFFEKAYVVPGDSEKDFKVTRLGYDELPIWAALAKTFLESYWIATLSFINKEEKNRKKTDLLKDMNYSGQRYHKLGLIHHMEAISQVTFSNAVRYINEDILRGSIKTEEDKAVNIEKLTRLSHRLQELAHYRP